MLSSHKNVLTDFLCRFIDPFLYKEGTSHEWVIFNLAQIMVPSILKMTSDIALWVENFLNIKQSSDFSGWILDNPVITMFIRDNFFHFLRKCFFKHPVGICLFKVNNGNTRKMCEICLKLTKKGSRITSIMSFWFLHY